MFPILLILLLLALHPTPGKTQEPECGRSRPRHRIVGGSNAMPGDWPWQVSLHSDGFPICGGSLITESWVLSAAHCVVEDGTLRPPEEFAVYLGLYSQLNQLMQDHGQYRDITEILVPDNYTDAEFGSDIALLHLSEPANLTEFVQTICLPQANHRFPHGASCWATGWGDIHESIWLPAPQLLQELELEIIGPSTCQCFFNSKDPFNSTIQLLPGMLCAGFKEGRKDTCQGDSGGPLVCEEAGQWFLAGITSFGHGCARRNRPGIFTAVAAYESWIRERVTGASFPEQPKPVAPHMPEEPPSNCTLALPECGSAPRPGHWPWKAIVVNAPSSPCHGVMVAEKWVLAPATCFLGLELDPTNWQVILPSARRVPVAQVVLNSNYTLDYGYDLALLELEVPVKFTEDRRPVCLPKSYHYFLPKGRCHLIQWGPGDVPSVNNSLLEAEMMAAWWCYCLHGQEGEEVPQPLMNPRILCAHYQEEEEMSSCWFGSRWSLLCQESGTWFLAGVSGPTESCVRPRVFSPVQLHSHWIARVALTAFLEDQLAWNWATGVVAPETCPLKTKYGACGLRLEMLENSNPWPWMAEVHGTRGGVCIGSLVSPSWVLAPTHCVTRQASTAAGLQVHLGTAGSQGYQVSRSITSIHFPYGMGSRAPLVLLKLETKVESSPSTLPVCLHSGPPPSDTSCWVLGWKDFANRVPTASPVSILSSKSCRCLYDDTLPYGTICVQYSKEMDRSGMDSGSSLLCEEERGSWVLVGISLEGSQELFTPVGTQEPWISQTVGEASFLAKSKFSGVLWDTSGLCPPDLSSAATVPRAALLMFLPLVLLRL
ncbi:polyserase-2-like [Trichosurus vulpecula]|uniref:polyserase-2-like n=1 Tax=Trichosurus vulpecula TaxID=9337 RepID=UPI00186B0FEC|nr:polyserase-2-like [Trichosurus vulpecula]